MPIARRSRPSSADAGPASRATARRSGYTTVDGDDCYRIVSVHRQPPFLVSVPSACDLWAFLGSRGGLTLGRVDANGSLFPYETVDRLHDGHHHTGPVTVLRVSTGADAPVTRWEPFGSHGDEDPCVDRSLAKSTLGDRLTYEETHHGLGLEFRARWAACDEFGWVRTVTLENRGPSAVRVSLLDGLRNLLPFGAPLPLYQTSSSLVDAYKRCDLDPDTGLAVYSLTSRIVDRPEPSEELHANVAWCHGLDSARLHLDGTVVDRFRRGEDPEPTHVLTGRRGNLLVSATFELQPGESRRWWFAMDSGLGHPALAALRQRIASTPSLGDAIEQSLTGAREDLRRIVAASDGLQLTQDRAASVHHHANVLFNVMRGGVFDRHHLVGADDFRAFVASRHRAAAERGAAFLAMLPTELSVADLLERAAAHGDADLERLAHEYLPLYFGRRHGDPSRPWNTFSIRVREADGRRALRFEGNWRDVFQNWEALAASYPGFLPGMIARFVNASTADGFNPYRITRDGVDWEVPEPDQPWSHIGYWGDHQVIYLLKLLEALHQGEPGRFGRLLGREVFSYADVPYRLRPYADIVRDPHDTIDYDRALAKRIAARVEQVGHDGRLLTGADGAVQHANLYEKLLVPALCKLSNLVPGGGIWMNTQRPEWNDANNALVGHGVSVVTLAHLRRYLAFLDARLAEAEGEALPVAAEVVTWFHDVHAVLREGRAADTGSDESRRAVMDALGRAFEAHRTRVYANGFSGERRSLSFAEVRAWCADALRVIDRSLAANRRADGLYHSYNVLEPARAGGAVGLRRLEVMLEGQVAALSSGMVSPAEAVAMLDRLFESPLHRADQRSFLLYPEKELPAFLDRNRLPVDAGERAPLLAALERVGDRRLVVRDAGGALRFHECFRNAADLDRMLDRLALEPEWTGAVARDRTAVHEVWERVFHHHAFTGRSGTMYGYEGLGSIYWHMVAKLLLAVQELAWRAADTDAPGDVRRGLTRHYFAIRSGLGFEKTAEEYGAFPFDPYSHTPRHAGAQQPGMTGQVKEEVLTRLGELGVRLEAGRLSFAPILLRRAELLREGQVFRGIDGSGEAYDLAVGPGTLVFTLAQVPVVMSGGEHAGWRVLRRDGRWAEGPGSRLPEDLTREWLARDGSVSRAEIVIDERALLDG